MLIGVAAAAAADRAWAALAGAGVGMAALALAWLLLRRAPPPPRAVRANEAMATGAIAIIAPSLTLVGAFVGWGLDWADALFEAVSAFTTTGLTTLASVEAMPAGFKFARAWAQWYGGLAFAVLALMLLGEPGLMGQRIAAASDPDEPITGTRGWAGDTLRVYLALTIFGFLLIWALCGDATAALLHAFAAVSTGGFSSLDAGLPGLGGAWVQAAVILVSVLGATSFALQARVARGDPGELLRDIELRAFLVTALAMSVAMAAAMAAGGRVAAEDTWWLAPLTVLSAHTTAGFTTLAAADLTPVAMGVLILAMLIGGDAGSTAGGLRVVRIMVMWRVVVDLLRRAAIGPNTILPSRVAGRPLRDADVRATAATCTLFAATIGASWLVFLAAGEAPLPSLLEVVSAVCTAGITVGVARPDLATGLKLLLCLDMLAGRVEVVALLVLLHPATWFGRRAVG